MKSDTKAYICATLVLLLVANTVGEFNPSVETFSTNLNLLKELFL